jgi:transient receptor potential cation channel subfamily V protein 6
MALHLLTSDFLSFNVFLNFKIVRSHSNFNKPLKQKQSKFIHKHVNSHPAGGDLIDAFNVGGQYAVEELIREQFGVFMYKSGKGQVINRAEYLRWKYMENAEVSIPIEASLSSHDPLGKWVDHKACWQMQYRGALGESLLHVLIICDTKVHTK